MIRGHVLRTILEDLSNFYGQAAYRDLGEGLSRKDKRLYFLLNIIRLGRRYRIFNFISLQYIVFFYRPFRYPEDGKEVFQYGTTKNNRRAFENLNSCLGDRAKKTISTNFRSPTLKERLVVLACLRDIWETAVLLSGVQRSLPYTHLQLLIGGAAFLLYSKNPIADSVNVMCVANDHGPVPKCLLILSGFDNRKSCYIQHAPVSQYFPPLRSHLAVLYDEYSAQAYEASAIKNGTPCNSDIVLMPPFEQSFKAPSCLKESIDVGIFLGLVTNVSAVRHLLKTLSNFDYVDNIFLRRHPANKFNFVPLAVADNVFLRDQNERLKDFMKVVDVALVPNSGVAIECLHSGVPTFYVEGMDELPSDYYGFVSDGVLPKFTENSLEPRNVESFFDAKWAAKFSRYDVTMKKSIADCRSRLKSVFEKFIANTT